MIPRAPNREPTSWPTGWVERPPRPDDVDLILELVNTRSRKLYGEDQATREGVTAFLANPRLDPRRDARLVLDPDGKLAGVRAVRQAMTYEKELRPGRGATPHAP